MLTKLFLALLKAWPLEIWVVFFDVIFTVVGLFVGCVWIIISGQAYIHFFWDL